IKEKLENLKIYKFIKVMFCVFIIFFIILEGMIILYPKNNTEKSDYLLILGAGVNGKTPSLTLKGRLDTTLEYLNKYDENVKIVVSGGQGPGEDISEAMCMKDYLMANGVDEEKIIMEDKSTSTGENFKFSKDILENYTGKKINELNIKVVTNDFHSLRSNMLGERQGYENLTFYTSKTNPSLIPVYYIRESIAFIKSYIFD
ncbi:MAG: YdcF family protein, partial [Clostridium sp.]